MVHSASSCVWSDPKRNQNKTSRVHCRLQLTSHVKCSLTWTRQHNTGKPVCSSEYRLLFLSDHTEGQMIGYNCICYKWRTTNNVLIFTLNWSVVYYAPLNNVCNRKSVLCYLFYNNELIVLLYCACFMLQSSPAMSRCRFLVKSCWKLCFRDISKGR